MLKKDSKYRIKVNEFKPVINNFGNSYFNKKIKRRVEVYEHEVEKTVERMKKNGWELSSPVPKVKKRQLIITLNFHKDR